VSSNYQPSISAKLVVGISILTLMTSSIARAAADSPHAPITPIRHLIVIVGENHSFDNLFGAYQPIGGQTVSNLLSKGIINADGTPGPILVRRNNGKPASRTSTRSRPGARSRSRRCRSRIPPSRSDANRMNRTHDSPPICRPDHSS
jgi:phospholipase C